MSLSSFVADVEAALKSTGQGVSDTSKAVTTASKTLIVAQVLTVALLLVIVVILLGRRR